MVDVMSAVKRLIKNARIFSVIDLGSRDICHGPGSALTQQVALVQRRGARLDHFLRLVDVFEEQREIPRVTSSALRVPGEARDGGGGKGDGWY